IAALRGVDAERVALAKEIELQRTALQEERAAILAEARDRALKDSMKAAAQVIVDAEAAAQSQLSSLEPEVAALVSTAVKQVIGKMDQSEAVTQATRRALLELKDHRQARILAAPDVVDAVRAAVAKVGADDGADVVDLQVDDRLEPGRTILSSDRGHVEIGLSDQVEAVTEAWLQGAAQ
ncbi:MAG: FliH/SctL family protein, partial [Pseudomonadota bacterium]